ncbi:MAG: ABC transporter ATP-binding protein [Deinococcota bacterium]|nr:ABC transporter ATP-binding protein [Deinococcota bacterium]
MLEVHDLTMSYGAEPVLEGVSLELRAGQFVSLVGPSGSGKSSLLRVVTGLQKASAGRVALEVPQRDIGFLFQDDALLPWRSAQQNVALGLKIRGMKRRQALAEAETWLVRLGLSGLAQRFPAQLSGGQRKRVALAQVLALRPKLVLMDEPFASLDAIVRHRITQELLDWVEREKLTVLLVTHDLEEALTLSDAVYLLSQGPRARVRERYPVPIPRPRDLLKARTHPAFAPLLERLWRDLSDEVGLAEVAA